MLKYAAACAATTCLLAGCGASDPAPGNTGQATLSGNWFFERQDAQGSSVSGESLIRGEGRQVTITYCDRLSLSLTRVGDQLFDREGRLHYLYVKDAQTLASRPELNMNTVIRKRGSSGRFDYGSVALTLPSGEAVTAATDVCADTATGRFGDSSGKEIAPALVRISLPYRDSYIRMNVAFRRIANGQYRVVDFEPFVQGGADEVTIPDFDSPGFRSDYGVDSLRIVSGTLQVSDYTSSAIVLYADLVTATGLPVKFTARVRLQPRS